MEIREIKQRLGILAVLNHYGLKPDRNDFILCPFHDDHNPSLKIYPNTNTFNCFGCGKNGDQIEFIQLKEKCSKHESLMKATSMINPIAMININKEPERMQETGRVEILTRIFKTFQNGLQSLVNKKAKQYLQQRNLDYTKLEMGYNSAQFHHRGQLSQPDQEACVRAGLLVPYRGSVPKVTDKERQTGSQAYTPFAKECIIFPLLDKQNQVVSLYGRSIALTSSATAPATGKHYYLKDRTGLYPSYPKPETTRLILTEAIIDAATLLQIREITSEYSILACYGTNGLTEEHQGAIRALEHLQEIIFAFDGDQAGREGIKRYAELLYRLKPQLRITQLDIPEGEDINSLAQSHELEIFTHLLGNRKKYYLNLTSNQADEKAETQPESASGGTSSFLLPEKKQSLPRSIGGNETQVPQEPIRTGKLNTRNPEFITYTTDELQIIILGGINLGQLDRLRVTLKISRTDTGDPLHSIRQTLDLYHSDYLEKFINKASEQLETGTNVLKRAIAELTEQTEKYRLTKIESMKHQKPQARQLTEQREKRAKNYLGAPRLMERTNDDIGSTGVIGEETNRLLMYLVFTSRLREQPLHIVSLGSSGTGKTYLQEKISELIPEQDKLEITILSENAFYYFDRKELKHKLVLIEDMDGAQDVLYPLRELQTKRKISKTIPIKDSKGNLRTITLHVEGPICLAGTTTRERLYEDNANRSLLIYIDNSNEHKELIMEYQRKLSAGKINTRQEQELKEFFKDMQSVLKPVKVRNPFAELLKLPEHVFKPLRTNAHYLAFIETVTFYHQYQREVKTDSRSGEQYIETTLEDIEWANKLLKDVLLAKSDELSGECRSFFERLKQWIKTGQKTSFFASQIRESFRMNPNNLKYYLVQLTRYGYIKPVGGDRYKRGFEYEVVNFDEYNKLNTSINSVFDEVLVRIKNKNKTSG